MLTLITKLLVASAFCHCFWVQATAQKNIAPLPHLFYQAGVKKGLFERGGNAKLGFRESIHLAGDTH